MQLTTSNKQNKLFIKSGLVILLLGISSISQAEEIAIVDSVLTFQEGFSVDFQTAKIKDVFDGSGVAINYQTSLTELAEDQSKGKVALYGRLHYQINEDGNKENLTQTEITLGVNWAFSDKTHFYIESGLMKRQLDVNNIADSQTFDISRIGGKYNFYKDFVVNASLEYRDSLKSDTGYKLAIETTNIKYALFSAGYLSVGNNQSMFFTLISKF